MLRGVPACRVCPGVRGVCHRGQIAQTFRCALLLFFQTCNMEGCDPVTPHSAERYGRPNREAGLMQMQPLQLDNIFADSEADAQNEAIAREVNNLLPAGKEDASGPSRGRSLFGLLAHGKSPSRRRTAAAEQVARITGFWRHAAPTMPTLPCLSVRFTRRYGQPHLRCCRVWQVNYRGDPGAAALHWRLGVWRARRPGADRADLCWRRAPRGDGVRVREPQRGAEVHRGCCRPNAPKSELHLQPPAAGAPGKGVRWGNR
jgi:hypothetical protein